MPGIAVRVHSPFPARIRPMPHDLLRPRQVRQHVLATEAVDSRRLREETSLPVEDALPRVEEHVTPRVHHRQVVIGLLHYCVQVLDPGEIVKECEGGLMEVLLYFTLGNGILVFSYDKKIT